MKDWRLKASEDLKSVTSEECGLENGEDWINRISDKWDSIGSMSVAVRTQQKEVFLRNSSCDICGKSYVSKGSLIAHKIFKHSQPSPIICKECPICNKTLNHVRKLTDLGSHIDLHMENHRKFSCDLCHRKFSKNRDMIRHVQSLHMNRKNKISQ